MKRMYVATIGMFDGVHRGHQFVLQQLASEAHRRGMQSLVFTFDRSPRKEAVLTPTPEKVQLLSAAGVDRVEVLPFTPELKAMTARQFMAWMQQQYDVRVLLTGYDNRFGHNRCETFTDYAGYGRELGIDVLPLTPAPMPSSASPSTVPGPASSSLVRQLLLAGQVAEAAILLGRPYSISGRITHGQHIGTSLGFPTANIQPDEPLQLIPAAGAYAVLANHRAAMMNIGTRPTFEGHETTLEAHVFGLEHDIYGQPMTVQFVDRLRDEQRFESAGALRHQLAQDALRAKELVEAWLHNHQDKHLK